MPVYDVSYRAWEGKSLRTRATWLAIVGTMVRRLLRVRLLRTFLFTVTGGAILLSGGLFYMVYQPGGMQLIRQLGGDANILAYGYARFFDITMYFAVLVAALSGAPLIAEDLRARALPLYFSRPITHVGYFFGKLATVGFFLGMILVVPLAGMYVVEILFSPVEGAAGRQLGTLFDALVPAGAAIAVFALLSLGASALVKKPVGAGLLFLGVVLFSVAIAAILAETFDDFDWLALAPERAISAIAGDSLDAPPVPGMTYREEANAKWGWVSVAAWSALGAIAIGWKVRRVEVVT